ncbi:hypothetical protein AB0N09_37860 [Streptomyces erythrochromogenes]|uniref:hypothetical protein n=1 Tax=Streptomyces erythrochromogenes TaxID=285574 RepID=UPI0034256C25
MTTPPPPSPADPVSEALYQLERLARARAADDHAGVQQALQSIAACLRELGDDATAQVISDALSENRDDSTTP